MTDTTFTLKQNAKRAASRMIAKGSAPAEPKAERSPRAVVKAGTPRKPREGTKQQAVIEMMRRPQGASGAEIMNFTGWSIVRGFIAGTVKKKLGLPVTTEKVEGRGTVYRIPAAA